MVDPANMYPNRAPEWDGPRLGLQTTADGACLGCGGQVAKSGPWGRERYCPTRCRKRTWYTKTKAAAC